MKKMWRIVLWAIFMASIGAFLAGKDSYETTWYGALIDKPLFPFVGALIGIAVGLLFSRRRRASK